MAPRLTLGGCRVNMDEQLRIRLFDGLALEWRGRQVTRFRTQKTASLLAYLAYHLGRSCSREALVELLWPESDPDAGRNSLSTALWSIRHQLQELGLVAGEVLIADRTTLRLDPDRIATDVRSFEEALTAARTAGPGGGPHLARALELYRGDLLRNLYDDWIFPEQARLGAAFQRAAQELVEQLEDAGEVDAALRWATHALRIDPLSEEMSARIMRLYQAAGRPHAALGVYRQLAQRLEHELEVRPHGELTALAARIAAGVEPPAALNTAAQSATAEAALPLEPVGGAIPLNSRFYIVREADAEFREAVERCESILLLKGPRQTGKTSLLARGLHRAREAGTQVVLTDLQSLTAAQIASLDSLFLTLAEHLADQLDLSPRPHTCWDPYLGPSLNLRRYLRREVLSRCEAPLMWALDEVDRLFSCAYASEVFGLFRSWHNERALDPLGPWSRLTLVLAYATEAHLFVSDLNQSPFNVGTRLEVSDLTPAQVADLNRQHGSPLTEAELARFHALLDGHPLLVRRGLYELVKQRLTLQGLEERALQPHGAFHDHLERLTLSLCRDPELCDTVRGFLRDEGGLPEKSFLRLRSAGVLGGETVSTARFRCELYRRHLERELQ